MTDESHDGLSRRALLRSAALGGVGLTLAASASSAAIIGTPAPLASDAGTAGPTVSGTVFDNRDGSGLRQPDSPGVAGVLVSNGREVVATDAEGRYSLPVADETIVFVIKPAGYATRATKSG